MFKASVDDLVFSTLNDVLGGIEQHFSADVLFIKAPMFPGVDDAIRHNIELIVDSYVVQKTKPPHKLCIILETTGGSIETVERIVRILRNHYKEVIFVIPNFAYSAGTVLALSGDELYMDYYSVLGPIDPQLPGEDGRYIPAIGYLQKYNQLVGFVNSNPANSRAELNFLISKFDPAKLFFIEQAKEHGKQLLKEWLPQYKFKNWKITKEQGKKVTPRMREERAEQIAETLGNPERWHSHGRGIGIRELTCDEIKLEVQNFGDNSNLNQAIRVYYDILSDFLSKKGIMHALHTKIGGVRSI